MRKAHPARRMRNPIPPHACRHAATAVAAVAIAAASPVFADEIPYAAFQARTDGDLAEWRMPFLQADFTDPDAPAGLRNRAQVRLAWDLDGLLVAGEIDDADRVDAPAGIDVEQFHQYDSIQVYLDPLDDSAERMNGDDVDLLLMPDGRSGVLRGDELVATLASARVPQRPSAPLAYAYAARATATGWRFELRLPFASLGIDGATARRMKIDIAMNDWVAPHPPGPARGFSVETLREGGRREDALPAEEVGTQLWPLTWDGHRDFGYPRTWRRVRLGGAAPLAESWVRRVGGGRALAVAGLAAAALAVLAALVTAAFARRRIRKLLARLDAGNAPRRGADDTPAEGAHEVPLVPTDDGGATEQAPTHPGHADAASGPRTDTRDRAFADRALAYARAHLDDDLSPTRLADALHVSVRSLQRRLRQGLDTTPQDLVLAARLEAAHALLRQGGLRVGEVAARVGFDDLSHFSRRFRAAYGMPPSQVVPSRPPAST